MYHLIVGVRIKISLSNYTTYLQCIDLGFFEGVIKYIASKEETHIFLKENNFFVSN